MTAKLNNQSIQSRASDAIKALVQGRNGITSLLRDCNTEKQVLLACESFSKEVKAQDKTLQPYLTRTWQNSVSQYVARCRTGEDKNPARWFDPTRTVSFSADPFAFGEYKPRQTKAKADKAADNAKAKADLDERAQELLSDKATLTKAQQAKVNKAQDSAKADVAKAQALAKQWQGKADKADTALNKQGQALQSLQADHSRLQVELAKAHRQIKALQKALELANVNHDAVQALVDAA